MIRIVLINHTFQKKQFSKRWRMLAEEHDDVDITLLAPMEYAWGKEKNLTYGHTEILQGVTEETERFRIHLIDRKPTTHGSWISPIMETEILNIKPDLVYFIGEHTEDALMQLFDIRKKHHLNDMKILAFSMRGHHQSLRIDKGDSLIRSVKNVGKYLYLKKRVKKLNKYCDAVFCHYPDALSEFRREGYKRSIYMQTQVGVDPDIFYRDEEARKCIREKYNIGDAYLFGSASRFHYSKGLSEIIKALPKEGNWKYLMMGWGRDDEVERIKSEIAQNGLQDRIILTGYIDNWSDMAEHWNALDCAVHAPLTTPDWEETFSLALVQAMITGLPVIGSSSGSVPYQIGEEGIIVPEKDTEAMREWMVRLMQNPEQGKRIGERMHKHAMESFSIRHLDELFYLTIKDIVNGVYDEAKVDMAKFST